ncbi:MAG TPA: DUF3149 domain-containing protein [Burkholderiaceae bacterium]|nr:DUF3149 domain-containing protein [Burkholderiaceae bacterium]
MDAWRELFSTPIGLMSLGTIAFVCVIGGYLYTWVRRKIAEEEQALASRRPS